MEGIIEGVFCKEKVTRIGTGHTSRKTVQKTYWYVQEQRGVFLCWPISPTGEKVGNPDTIDAVRFTKDFTVDFSYPTVRPITEKDMQMCRILINIQILNKAEDGAKKLLAYLFDNQDRFPIDLHIFLLEIGAAFRKGELFHVALLAYQYVQELGIKNSALYFNIARVYFDMKEYHDCIQYLKDAYELSNGANNSIKQLLLYMHKNSLVPREDLHAVAKMI